MIKKKARRREQRTEIDKVWNWRFENVVIVSSEESKACRLTIKRKLGWILL